MQRYETGEIGDRSCEATDSGSDRSQPNLESTRVGRGGTYYRAGKRPCGHSEGNGEEDRTTRPSCLIQVSRHLLILALGVVLGFIQR